MIALMIKYIKFFANIISIIFVFIIIPIDLISDYSQQRGRFQSMQGPDTDFSKNCVNTYLPGINEYIKQVYCRNPTTWLDRSVIISFKVKNEDSLKVVLDKYVYDGRSDQEIYIGCNSPAWWRISAEGERLMKFVPIEKIDNTIKALWVNRKHGEIIVLYEYYTM